MTCGACDVYSHTNTKVISYKKIQRRRAERGSAFPVALDYG